jgi:dissimilatory sulfite reductase (desulfoviridin) alpha/beta subunit
MEWSKDAEDALRKVPFFVRKRVRARVEKEARQEGKPAVTLAEVKATQKRYLTHMAEEVRGYRLGSCFGSGGCPKRAVISDQLFADVEAALKRADLLNFLKKRVPGELKFHHEIRVTLADCPNACSQPQIKDIGIIGALEPLITAKPCSGCNGCLEVCPDGAVALSGREGIQPEIDFRSCQHCGLCIAGCPTETLVQGARGYRVQLGGKLGRHPRLARELPGIYSHSQVVGIVEYCLDYYKAHSKGGERFGALMTDEVFQSFVQALSRAHP